LKTLFLSLLIFAATTCYAQNAALVLIKTTSGAETKCKILGHEETKWRLELESGRVSTVDESIIESIDGIKAPECFETFKKLGNLLQLPIIDGKITYTGVVHVDSLSSEELYKRSKRWFFDTYNSGKDVIQLDDKESGEIIGKGFFETYWQSSFLGGISINVYQTIKVQVKDGRYKYEITDFKVKYFVPASQYTRASNVDEPLETWNTWREENCNKIRAQIDLDVKGLIASFEKFVRTKPQDDW
jgi:hypothetical protein